MTQAFIYLAAAVVMVPVARRLGLGSVLGYLVAGVLIGPWVFRLVGHEGQDVMHAAEFGVVMMLFLVGLELQPRLLWRLRGPLFGMGGLQVAGTAVVVAAVTMPFGLPWNTALAVGLILSMSSTAIVLQSLQERNVMQTEAGRSGFAVLLFQDLAVIPMLALLPLLAAPGAVGHAAADAHAAAAWIDTLPAWGRGLATLGAITAVVLVGQIVVGPAFRVLAAVRVREILTAAALLLVVGIALLMQQVGLSPALGTFLAGVVLANSEYRHELETDLEPFKGLLLGLFFIAVGASVDLGLIAREGGRIGGMVAGLVVLKAAVLFTLARAFRLSAAQSTLFALALAQGGEFAFVLVSFATANGVLAAAQAGPLVATVALSMAVTPLLLLLEERVLRPRLGARPAAERPADAIEEHHAVLIAGFGHFGSIVGRLLAAHGIRATVLDADSEHIERLRRLGYQVFYGDASRHDLLRLAGAETARLLVVATGGREATLAIVHAARRHFPHLPIVARARGRDHAYELLAAGVEHVYRDNLDTALRLGEEALAHLGIRAHAAHRAAQQFRRHDEAALRELYAMRGDQARYLSTARARIRELEERLLGELERPVQQGDHAWDAETLREEMVGAARLEPGAGGVVEAPRG
jgi:monovalent cation:proton antiporter-2 (CPA2) family protein